VRWTHKLMREVVAEERDELGLAVTDKFDPYLLAEKHGIPVYGLSTLSTWGAGAAAQAHFAGINAGKWSAALIPLGHNRFIVEHDGHAVVRRRASIAHELGHLLLEHEFGAALIGVDHERVFDPAREKEAAFMAGELLIPEEAARKAAFANWSNDQVSIAYGVSTQFAQMQMKGMRVVAQRTAVKWARR
jgi:hypothetical protein